MTGRFRRFFAVPLNLLLKMIMKLNRRCRQMRSIWVRDWVKRLNELKLLATSSIAKESGVITIQKLRYQLYVHRRLIFLFRSFL